MANHSVSDISLDSDLDFAEETRCNAFEYLVYADSPNPMQSECELDDSSLSGWLAKDLNMSIATHGKSQSPIGGLRFLIFKYDWVNGSTKISSTKNALDLVLTHFKVPWDILLSTFYKTCFSYRFSKIDGTTKRFSGFVLKLISSYPETDGELVTLYDAKTNITYALLFSEQDHLCLQLIKEIQQNKSFWSSPIMLPLTIIQIVIIECQKHVNDLDDDLVDVTTQTGQHGYTNISFEDPFEIDFLSTTRTLNTLNHNIGLRTSTIRSLMDAIKKLRGFREELKVIRSSNGENFDAQALNNNDIEIEEKMDYLAARCSSLIFMAEYLEKKSATLIQVVFQFMAQKDTKINIALAKSTEKIAHESKKDSSAMKTISILGMLFLPGTFIATLFAMPVFNWEADGAPILKPGFRYYWAVTLPLTLIIFLAWSLAISLPWRKWIADSWFKAGP